MCGVGSLPMQTKDVHKQGLEGWEEQGRLIRLVYRVLTVRMLQGNNSMVLDKLRSVRYRHLHRSDS